MAANRSRRTESPWWVWHVQFLAVLATACWIAHVTRTAWVLAGLTPVAALALGWRFRDTDSRPPRSRDPAR